MTRRLRVVLSETTRSGSPKVAFELLEDLVRRSRVVVEVEDLRPGPLSSAFSASFEPASPASHVDAVLVNGSLGADVLLDEPSAPTAVYVHEDDEALTRIGSSTRRVLTDRADLVLCVSEVAAQGLAAMGVRADRLRVVPPVVGQVVVPDDDERRAVRRQLGLGDDEHLVVGCGQVAWHKGPDLFIDMGRHLVAARPSVRLVWVGWRGRSLGRLLDHDRQLLGLEDRLTWIGEQADPFGYLAAAEVLVSTSRRDARPAVPLEAALCGTPTAAFAVGGLAALGGLGAATVVPFPDTRALAAAVADLIDDPSRGDPLVLAATAEATRRGVDVVGPIFATVIDELTAMRRTVDRTGGPR